MGKLVMISVSGSFCRVFLFYKIWEKLLEKSPVKFLLLVSKVLMEVLMNFHYN